MYYVSYYNSAEGMTHNSFRDVDKMITFLERKYNIVRDHGKSFLVIKIFPDGEWRHIEFKSQRKGYPLTIFVE